MIRILKDSYKLSLLVATIFFVSILVSAYFLYSVPHTLMVSGTAPVFIKAYLAVAVSFALGALAIYIALSTQREIVVYRDRVLDENTNGNSSADENRTTITLDGVRSGLEQSKNEKDILKAYIQSVCKQLEAGQGALYLVTEKEGSKKVELKSGYALNFSENTSVIFDFGEGLIGQCAANEKTLYVDDVPEGYIKIISGLGSASPRFILIAPVLKGQTILGVVEIASFAPINQDQRKFVEESAQLLADKIK